MKTITLEGRTRKSFFLERNKLMEEGATSGPIYTTADPDISYEGDEMVYIPMALFLRKRKNKDFSVVEDRGGTLVGYSKFLFL